VARSFCVKIKLPKEMPKIVKCLKLRYSIDFKKRKRQGMPYDSFADCWFFMLKIPSVYIKDGAKRHHNFSHFSHFSSLQAFSGLSGLGIVCSYSVLENR
jgi:hypothetical protein